MRKIILSLSVIFALTSGAIAEDIEPELEAAIRERAADVLLDPYSAAFTYDVIVEIAVALNIKRLIRLGDIQATSIQ